MGEFKFSVCRIVPRNDLPGPYWYEAHLMTEDGIKVIEKSATVNPGKKAFYHGTKDEEEFDSHLDKVRAALIARLSHDHWEPIGTDEGGWVNAMKRREA